MLEVVIRDGVGVDVVVLRRDVVAWRGIVSRHDLRDMMGEFAR